MFAKNSFFSKNVNSLNGVIVDAGGKYKALVDMYTKLSLYVKTIRILIKQYASGNFDTVAHALTQENYNKLSIEIASLSADGGKYPDYENLRLGITDSLQGLYQSILQHNILLDTEAKLSVANNNLQILYDPVKLQDWINKMNQRRTLFGESKVQPKVKATVKPEYAEYIKLYGYPPGGNFDMNKLAGILVKLGIQPK